MEINLCYKTYPFKISLAACKQFAEQSGTDLQYALLKYIEATADTKGMGAIERMAYLQSIFTFDIASKLLHSLIKQENKNIPLVEIQDAMFKVSWLPTEDDSVLCQPWPLVMIDVATQVNTYFNDNLPKKKD